MFIIGCDYHPSVQQIAWVDTESGGCGEQRLRHCEEAEQFYRELQKQGVSVRVGMEATGHSRWWHLSRKLCLEGSCGGFEARLEHGIELGQGGAEGAARVAPALRLETLNCAAPIQNPL